MPDPVRVANRLLPCPVGLIVLSFAVVLAGCSESAQEPSAVKNYPVRGKVVSVSAASGEVKIHHEAVPALEDRTGKVVGMNAMVMAFTVRGADVSALKPGDKVAFTMAVDWSADPHYWATDLKQLPADTALDFGPAKRPATRPATRPASDEGDDG